MDFFKITPSNSCIEAAKAAGASSTALDSSLIAYKASLFKESGCMYLVAGIHGNEIEGIYILNELHKWMQEETSLELPIVIIPILNISGYLYGIKENSQGLDLDKSFPSHWKQKSLSNICCESFFIKELFENHPPDMVFTFRSQSYASVITTKNSKEIADFFYKYNEYPILEWRDKDYQGTLEGYAVNFFDAEVISFRYPRLEKGQTLQELWNKTAAGFKNFFLGQWYY